MSLMILAPIINKWIYSLPPSIEDLKIVIFFAIFYFSMSSLSGFKMAFGSEEIEWFKNFGIYIIYFFLGHLIGSNMARFRFNPWVLVAIFISVLALAIVTNYILAVRGVRGDNIVIGDNTVLGFVATCSLFALAARLNIGKCVEELLHKYALNSFGVYLIHPFILFFSHKFMLSVTLNEVLALIGSILIAVMLSFFTTSMLRRSYFGSLIT
ncbi:MAG: acyltransferase family protein [Cellvibrio sp.]|nr:acyltransferase family protein [Cellvibrio sp.]